MKQVSQKRKISSLSLTAVMPWVVISLDTVKGILELGGKLNWMSHQYLQHHYDIITCSLSFLLTNCMVSQNTERTYSLLLTLWSWVPSLLTT